MEDHSTALASKLEDVTEQALDKLSAILRLPIDEENGSLLRAMTTASAVAINAQLRADALRLRAMHHDKALDRLVAAIKAKELTTPNAV